ncbi:epoxyqueuosine reductase QueH [Candidatus Parcubacteria bacterium]|jgi:epoxyqueuosine reductase|nr:epoxyqueuosine reductase QueH [Candidatus Parcubacteria bacterium]MBT3948578.1 epoxyqueuosine reductase QueH [Candidatus Parcubacteria bacterium]
MSKQRFLLHTCCAPCSIAIVDELKSNYDLTVFFYNPNIHPEEEYLKRKKEVVRVCEEWNVPMVDMDYEVEKWNDAVKGLEKEPEGGARCSKCFAMRLKHAAEYAGKNGFDIYSTSLTSGRNKKADIICPLGVSFGEKYGVEFHCEDWKKGGRQEKGKKMIEDRDIYRQDYCGCVYSKAGKV